MSNDPFATGQVLISPGSTFDQERKGVEDAFSEKTVEVKVPGADAAYATVEGSVVAMKVGDLFVQVSYIPSGSGKVTDITTSLAATAVSNL